jgi:hypothetical protein
MRVLVHNPTKLTSAHNHIVVCFPIFIIISLELRRKGFWVRHVRMRRAHGLGGRTKYLKRRVVQGPDTGSSGKYEHVSRGPGTPICRERIRFSAFTWSLPRRGSRGSYCHSVTTARLRQRVLSYLIALLIG